MGSRAQRLLPLIPIANAFGFKAVNSFNGKSMKEFDAEGALAARIPEHHDPAVIAKRDAEPCDCDAQPDEEHKERCRFWSAPETRECEGCGERKPIEEMATVFWRGCETYQCEKCRGGA